MGSGAALPATNSAFVKHAMGADVLVSGAVAPPSGGHLGDSQEPTSHGFTPSLGAAALGALAAQLGVDRLMLARLDMRCVVPGYGWAKHVSPVLCILWRMSCKCLIALQYL
eukprot:scaffold168670_cov19-Tisochrysis_lutea.AAC.1